MHNFKELVVWKKAMELATCVYSATKDFPNSEKYGLTSQINRSVVSIPSNIAEGSGRKTKKDFDSFLAISLSSAFELETQLIIAKNLEFLKKESFEVLITNTNEVQKMIVGLRRRLTSEAQN